MRKLKTKCIGMVIFFSVILFVGNFSYAAEKKINLLIGHGPTMWSMYPISELEI